MWFPPTKPKLLNGELWIVLTIICDHLNSTSPGALKRAQDQKGCLGFIRTVCMTVRSVSRFAESITYD